jgi:hypothetical protein
MDDRMHQGQADPICIRDPTSRFQWRTNAHGSYMPATDLSPPHIYVWLDGRTYLDVSRRILAYYTM